MCKQITRQLANKATIFFKEVQLIVSLLVNVQRQGLHVFCWPARLSCALNVRGKRVWFIRRRDFRMTWKWSNKRHHRWTCDWVKKQCPEKWQVQICHTFFEPRFGDSNDEVLIESVCWLASSTNGQEETRAGVKTGRVFCFLDKIEDPPTHTLNGKFTDVK